jgi:dipeptidyl aminopeptidase/acylaminoacyl peptidase
MLDRSGLSDVHELKLNGVQTKLVIFHKENYDLSRKCRSKNIIERLNQIIIWFKTYI